MILCNLLVSSFRQEAVCGMVPHGHVGHARLGKRPILDSVDEIGAPEGIRVGHAHVQPVGGIAERVLRSPVRHDKALRTISLCNVHTEAEVLPENRARS